VLCFAPRLASLRALRDTGSGGSHIYSPGPFSLPFIDQPLAQLRLLKRHPRLHPGPLVPAYQAGEPLKLFGELLALLGQLVGASVASRVRLYSSAKSLLSMPSSASSIAVPGPPAGAVVATAFF
jgi:hypothetical protein